MSNTIRKPRKRPRVKSSNFRTLGWLIRREAMFRIVQRARVDWGPSAERVYWANIQTPVAELATRHILRDFPERRYYP